MHSDGVQLEWVGKSISLSTTFTVGLTFAFEVQVGLWPGGWRQATDIHTQLSGPQTISSRVAHERGDVLAVPDAVVATVAVSGVGGVDAAGGADAAGGFGVAGGLAAALMRSRLAGGVADGLGLAVADGGTDGTDGGFAAGGAVAAILAGGHVFAFADAGGIAGFDGGFAAAGAVAATVAGNLGLVADGLAFAL